MPKGSERSSIFRDRSPTSFPRSCMQSKLKALRRFHLNLHRFMKKFMDLWETSVLSKKKKREFLMLGQKIWRWWKIWFLLVIVKTWLNHSEKSPLEPSSRSLLSDGIMTLGDRERTAHTVRLRGCRMISNFYVRCGTSSLKGTPFRLISVIGLGWPV